MKLNAIMRKRAEEAFSLYKIYLVWCIHQRQAKSFDAWGYNFNTSMKFETFLGHCFTQGLQANGAYRSSARLAVMGIGPDEYIPYVVVTCGEYTKASELANEERIKAYLTWKGRPKPREMVEEDFTIDNGVPKIMREPNLSDLEKAEIISSSNAWERLWGLRDQSNFMFEVYWSRIYCYRGLYDK